MSVVSPVPQRGTAVYVLATMCLVIMLVYLAGNLLVLAAPAPSAMLAQADTAMRVRILAPIVIFACMYLAAGVAVYMVRTEALAFMGCLLARQVGRMIQAPVQLTGALDVLLVLALVFFMMRLFQRAPALRARGQSGSRHLLAMLLVGLAAGQLTVLVNYLQSYPALVANGSISPLAALAALTGCAAMYAAVAMMRARPERAKKFFLFAAVAAALALPAWRSPYGLSTPFWLCVPIALFGCVLCRQARVH